MVSTIVPAAAISCVLNQLRLPRVDLRRRYCGKRHGRRNACNHHHQRQGNDCKPFHWLTLPLRRSASKSARQPQPFLRTHNFTPKSLFTGEILRRRGAALFQSRDWTNCRPAAFCCPSARSLHHRRRQLSPPEIDEEPDAGLAKSHRLLGSGSRPVKTLQHFSEVEILQMELFGQQGSQLLNFVVQNRHFLEKCFPG